MVANVTPGLSPLTVNPPAALSCWLAGKYVRPFGEVLKLYFGVPPLTAKLMVLAVVQPVTLITPDVFAGLVVTTSAGGVGGVGGVGGAAVPGWLISVAVVCRPVASTIVNVSGLTQLPFVSASKAPPDTVTGVCRIVTAVGKDRRNLVRRCTAVNEVVDAEPGGTG